MKDKSPFRDDQVWYFDDLTGLDREQAEERGCEPGKAYCGEPLDDNEVPMCPFCHLPVWSPLVDWDKSRCKHLVCAYDMNSALEYINPDFAKVFWAKLYPDTADDLRGIYKSDELSAMRDAGEIPNPVDLQGIVEGFQVYSKSSHFGDRGLDCGFVSDRFLTEHSLGQGAEGDTEDLAHQLSRRRSVL